MSDGPSRSSGKRIQPPSAVSVTEQNAAVLDSNGYSKPAAPSNEAPSSPSSPMSKGQADYVDGHSPAKVRTPGTVAAEHLRYGHLDYEEVEEEEEERRRHYLIRKPKVKQWFYKGKLFRSAEGRASARIEL
jgi:uncharacterized protein with LGFP repeats